MNVELKDTIDHLLLAHSSIPDYTVEFHNTAMTGALYKYTITS